MENRDHNVEGVIYYRPGGNGMVECVTLFNHTNGPVIQRLSVKVALNVLEQLIKAINVECLK